MCGEDEERDYASGENDGKRDYAPGEKEGEQECANGEKEGKQDCANGEKEGEQECVNGEKEGEQDCANGQRGGGRGYAFLGIHATTRYMGSGRQWEENLTKKHFEKTNKYNKPAIDLREGNHHGVKWIVVPLCVEVRARGAITEQQLDR